MSKSKKLIITSLLLGVGAYFAFPYYQIFRDGNTKVLTLKENEEKAIFIPSESTANDVVNLLFEEKLIKKSKIDNFLNLASKKNYDGHNVVPGKYTLKGGMELNQLINHLRAGNGRQEVAVTFNSVRFLEDLAGAVGKTIETDSSELIRYLKSSDTYSKYGFNHQTFMSMFLPNTYSIDWATSPEEFIDRMAHEYKNFWTENRIQKANALGLSQSKVSTLASIVYAETKKADESARIAGVYVNRLEKGMPLQADPTLIWAIGDFNIKRVLNSHKEIDSPYNTYKNKGLPPGPINIPPSSYVDAVLNYEDHNYLFFCAKEDFSGYANFARTYKQHLANAKRYQKALNRKKIYH